MSEQLTTTTTAHETVQQTAGILKERFRLQGRNMVALGDTPEGAASLRTAMFAGAEELRTVQDVDNELTSRLKQELIAGRQPSDRFEAGRFDKQTYSASLLAAEREVALEDYVEGYRRPSNFYDAALRVARGISLDGTEVSKAESADGRAVVTLLEKPEFYDALEYAIALREIEASKAATPPSEKPDSKYLSREERAKFATWRQQAAKGSEGLGQLTVPTGVFEEAARIYSDDLETKLDGLQQEGKLDEAQALVLEEKPGIDALRLALKGSGDVISKNVTLAARAAREGKVPVDEVTFRHAIHSLGAFEASDEQTERLRASIEQMAKRLGESALPEVVRVQLV